MKKFTLLFLSAILCVSPKISMALPSLSEVTNFINPSLIKPAAKVIGGLALMGLNAKLLYKTYDHQIDVIKKGKCATCSDKAEHRLRTSAEVIGIPLMLYGVYKLLSSVR